MITIIVIEEIPDIFEDKSLNNHGDITQTKIIYLNSYSLTENDISLLLKGLKFCHTPEKFDYTQERVDMNNVCRKIKLIEYFSGQTTIRTNL